MREKDAARLALGAHHEGVSRQPFSICGGQTLLELLVCLAIAGVMFALALPRYTRWSDEVAAREATSELTGALGRARELAVVRAGFVSVVLDARHGTAALTGKDGTLALYDLASRYAVTLSANRDSLVYDPRGIGYGAATATIVIRRGAAAETVTVARMGRVHW